MTAPGDPERGDLPERLVRLAGCGVPVTRNQEDAGIKRGIVWRYGEAA